MTLAATMTAPAEIDAGPFDADMLYFPPDPAESARVVAGWLDGIADRLEAGERLDTFDAIWPLLVAEAKLREVMQAVAPGDREAAERCLYGRVVGHRYMWGAGPMAAWLTPLRWRWWTIAQGLKRAYAKARANQADRPIAARPAPADLWGT